MDQIDHGHVTSEELLAYAAGDASADSNAHVSSCPDCTTEAAAYAATEQRLRSLLYRSDCPSTLQLGELELGLLAPDDALQLRTHLTLCPHCSAELAALHLELQDDLIPVQIPLSTRLMHLVARLVSAPGPGLSYAGVRGAGSEENALYEAEGVSIALRVERDESTMPRRWTLLGLVTEDSGDLVAGHVRLYRDGATVAEGELDDLGNLVLTGLESGAYDLDITLSDRVIAIEGIEVGPNQG